MISGLDIARSVAHHYKAHWQLAVKSAGLNAYLERETNYENTVSTSVFTLAIISAAQDFQYGALTEYDIVPSITRNSKKDPVDIVQLDRVHAPSLLGDSIYSRGRSTARLEPR